MNFNKIHEEIKRRKIHKTEFITDQVGMTLQGFNTAVKKQTLTVKKLEEISELLNVPISYWWNDEPSNAMEPEFHYGSDLMEEVRRLRRQIDGYVEKETEYREKIKKLEQEQKKQK